MAKDKKGKGKGKSKGNTAVIEAVEELEELETEDSDEETEETEAGVTPKMLAKELGVNPKVLRAFLRKTYPRTDDAKNTSWKLSDEQCKAAREHFSEEEDDDSDEV